MTLRRESGYHGRSAQQRRQVIIIAGIAVVVTLIIYIIYAINQPSKKPFSAVEEQNGISNSSTTPQTTNENEILASPDKVAQNPLAEVLDMFDVYWNRSYQLLQKQSIGKDLSFAFPAMDIFRADIFKDVDQFIPLRQIEIGNSSENSQKMTLSLKPQSTDIYTFSMTTKEGNLLNGELDVQRQAMYYIVKGENAKTIRFVEILRQGMQCYAQMLTSEEPYNGVMFYMFSEDGSVRSAYTSDQKYTQDNIPLSQIYNIAPQSWEMFSSNGVPYFSLDANEQIPMETSNQSFEEGYLTDDAATSFDPQQSNQPFPTFSSLPTTSADVYQYETNLNGTSRPQETERTPEPREDTPKKTPKPTPKPTKNNEDKPKTPSPKPQEENNDIPLELPTEGVMPEKSADLGSTEGLETEGSANSSESDEQEFVE